MYLLPFDFTLSAIEKIQLLCEFSVFSSFVLQRSTGESFQLDAEKKSVQPPVGLHLCALAKRF
jgi:hypothetical protein